MAVINQKDPTDFSMGPGKLPSKWVVGLRLEASKTDKDSGAFREETT